VELNDYAVSGILIRVFVIERRRGLRTPQCGSPVELRLEQIKKTD